MILIIPFSRVVDIVTLIIGFQNNSKRHFSCHSSKAPMLAGITSAVRISQSSIICAFKLGTVSVQRDGLIFMLRQKFIKEHCASTKVITLFK